MNCFRHNHFRTQITTEIFYHIPGYSHSPQKLFKINPIHFQIINISNRIRRGTFVVDSRKWARYNYIIFIIYRPKFKWCDRFLTFLNFIQKNQCFSRNNFLFREAEPHTHNHSIYGKISRKYLHRRRHLFKINFNQFFIIFFGKTFNGICLSCLSGTLNDKALLILCVYPVFHKLCCFSF